MADISPHLMTLFTAALERPPGPERSAYLDVACGGDAALREELEALLAVSGRAGGFLEGPAKAAERTADLPPAAEAPGRVVGPYKLVEQIGEGGMGTVWMAQQTEPVKRLVALKLIKAGMDSKQVIARFEAERFEAERLAHVEVLARNCSVFRHHGRAGQSLGRRVRDAPLPRALDETFGSPVSEDSARRPGRAPPSGGRPHLAGRPSGRRGRWRHSRRSGRRGGPARAAPPSAGPSSLPPGPRAPRSATPRPRSGTP